MNTKRVELPPDQSLRIVTDKKSGSFLLLSVSDDPINFGEGSPYADFSSFSKVQIFSESIAFIGNLLSPHGISLSCNEITINRSVEINASGAPGTDQAIGGSEAEPGQQGGAINFYIQSGSDEVSKGLSFVAKGGKGGDVVIKGAQGGRGGDGGHSVRIFQSRYSDLLAYIYEFLNRKDASQDEFALPIQRNDPIVLAASQLLTFAERIITEKQQEAFANIEALRKQLTLIKTGTNSYTVRDLVVKVRFVRNAIEGLAHAQQQSFDATVSFEGGFGGSGKGVQGVTGAKGDAGSDTCLFLSTYNPDISKTTFAFVHPEQCSMLLDRAKILYYMNSPQLSVRAGILFHRLMKRLSFLPAYPSPDDAKLKSIRTEAANWLTQLGTGVDFNGHPDNWAPRASYTFYTDMLDTALKDHAAFENAYIQYHAALKKQEKLTASVGLALDQTAQMINSLNIQIADLVNQLQETERLVLSLTEPVIVAHKALDRKFQELKDRIKNSFELSVPQLMNTLSFMYFGSPMGVGVPAANLLYEGFDTVPDLEGRPVNKKLIFSKLKRAEATVKSFKDILGPKIDGEFNVEDPFGTGLLAAEEDMMYFLDAFSNSSFADVIEQIKGAFDAFIKAVVDRNEQALFYNIQLKLCVEKISSKKDYEQKQKDLKGKEIESQDPDLQAITAYMADIYQSSRARVMQLLNNLVRSLTFRMLKKYDIYELAFQGTEADKDKVPLTITSDVLLSGRSRVQSEFGKMVEIWGSEPARFPPNFDGPGKRIYLSDAELHELIEKRRTVVVIPVVEKTTERTNDFSGCCNVRIYRVRFGLTGLATKNQDRARAAFTLTHSGKETIMDRENIRHAFEHDPVSTNYSFNLYSDGRVEVLDNGNIAEADINNTATSYAAPGPFECHWTVDLKNSELDSLDFSNVGKAYFDFCGTNYAFRP